MHTLADTTAHGFDALYGLRIRERDDGLIDAEVAVRDELRQPHGRIHGGVYAALAESLATLGTSASAPSEPIPESSQMTFLRPITEGTIHAHAHALHRGRTTWVWEIEITDDRHELCALARLTIALRTPPAARHPARR